MAIFSDKSLRFSLFILVLLAALPAIVLALISSLEERKHRRLIAFNSSFELAKEIASDHKQLIENTHQIFFSLAQAPQIQRLDKAGSEKILASLLKESTGYTAFALAEANGEVVASAPPFKGPVSFADRPYFQRVLKKRELVIGEYLRGRISGKLTVVIAYPVMDDKGRLRGVLAAGLDLERLGESLLSSGLPKGAALTIFDRNGRILYRNPDPQKLVGRTMADRPLVKHIIAHKEGVVEAGGLTGEDNLYGFAGLGRGGENLYLAVGSPKKTVYADVNRKRARNFIFLGLVALLAICAAWLVGERSIMVGIKALVSVAERLGSGKLETRTELPHTRGELGQLAAAFDRMAEAI